LPFWEKPLERPHPHADATEGSWVSEPALSAICLGYHHFRPSGAAIVERRHRGSRHARWSDRKEVRVATGTTGTGAGEGVDPSWRGLCRIGGVASYLMIACAMVTMVVVVTLGGEPVTPDEYFELLSQSRFVGLLRMDLASLGTVGLYYLVFFGLYAALRRSFPAEAALATALGFVGVTLWFARHSALSMVHLADRYAAAGTDAERAALRAAAEATLAGDVWHSTGVVVGTFLLMGAGVLVSVLMLRSGLFGKVAGWSGILCHGLDLGHIVINLATGGNLGDYLMAVAGPLYLVWFILVGRRLLQLGRPDLLTRSSAATVR
jgi:hypothetical protein